MGRLFGSVILGYIAMFALIYATFTLAYVIMGTEGAFQPESFQASTGWIIISIILSIIAALAGGYVCVMVARDQKAAIYLAGFVFILGLVVAIPVLTHDDSNDPQVRSTELSGNEAMMQAKQPTWLTLLTPFIGALGAWFGGGLRREERYEELVKAQPAPLPESSPEPPVQPTPEPDPEPEKRDDTDTFSEDA